MDTERAVCCMRSKTEARRVLKNEGLDRYCRTDAERELWAALLQHGGDYTAMAAALDSTAYNVTSRLSKLRKRASARGWAPNHDMVKETPDGFGVKGVSTLYTPDAETGELRVAAQWVKTDRDKEDRAAALAVALEELVAPIRGCMTARRSPAGDLDADLMCIYGIGDHHHGMYSWAAETGADYDVNISERVLNDAVDSLAAGAPRAKRAALVSVGDFFHADNHSGRTPNSGAALDTDSRHSRVIQSGIRMWRRNIAVLLSKHEIVDVVVVAGNHDPESSIWLAHALAAAYDNEPRVRVQLDPRAHRYLVHGKCLFGFTHGDRSKPGDLMEIMAVDRRSDWGVSKWCHWITGHLHHEIAKGYRGGTFECLKVLGPGDAWHIGQGYRSARGMTMSTWHVERGRVMTHHGMVEYG